MKNRRQAVFFIRYQSTLRYRRGLKRMTIADQLHRRIN